MKDIYFPDFIFNLEANSDYTITLIPGFQNKATFEYWSVWIDFNADGYFSPAEKIFSATKKRSTISGTISIPDLVSMETRMRIAMSRDGLPNACGDIANGEVEDYTINITGQIPPAPESPVAAFNADKTTIAPGETVNFSDESTNLPTSWSWTFEGGSPSIDNTQNPSITYNTIGDYSVSLMVSNNVGSNSVTKSAYIIVQEPLPPVLEYCQSKSVSSSKEWISSVRFGDIFKNSAASEYSDFTEVSTILTVGKEYNLTLTPDFLKNNQREFWKVWIDLNQDSKFDDTEELFSASNARSTVSGIIVIPETANPVPGQTRMRVSMKATAAPTACEIFDRGEVEDYSVIIETNKNAIIPVNEESSELVIYPNPAGEFLNIRFQSELNSTLRIFNSNGSIMLEKHLKTRIEPINIQHFAAGVYYISVQNELGNFRTKFIKR